MVLRKRALLTLGAAAALGMGLVACTPAGPVGPTLAPISTPAETEIERQTRLDFEAAEKAYRTFSAEYDRLLNSGGAPAPSDVLKATAAGPFLKTYAGTLKKAHESGSRSRGEVRILWIKRGGYSIAELKLNACEDGSGIKILDSKGNVLGTGDVGVVTLTVRKLDGRWKIWDSVLTEDPTCQA